MSAGFAQGGDRSGANRGEQAGRDREFVTIANIPTAPKTLTRKLARSGAALRFLLRSQAMRPGTAAWLSRRR